MLNKLLKYEFKSTGRTFLPVYGALLITSFLTRLFVFNKDFSNSFFLSLFQVVISSLFGFLLMAVCILTLVVSLQRFYKNLLGEEGYLSMTLPVRPWQHILCKSLTSLVWYIFSSIAAILAFVILAYEKGMLGDFFKAIVTLIRRGSLNAQILTACGEFFLFAALGILAFTMMLYASMALGQLNANKRLLTSFGAFLALNFLVQILMGVLGNLAVQWVFPMSSRWALNVALLLSIVVELFFLAGFFAITNYILSRKLNLE
ncbi:hypothetical protein [Intestinimonas butyriciproducens]|uniref:hypothetical protein n=1 Tax=Intestinimonas butyriciproducens TaxID=1297617 RepID=UPI00195CA65E|nr:hypothetical protein [Intestinimonas butyriciproducens]MBM6918345.1 hypothetical protein [Intestinimonas butyriciproducens]